MKWPASLFAMAFDILYFNPNKYQTPERLHLTLSSICNLKPKLRNILQKKKSGHCDGLNNT